MSWNLAEAINNQAPLLGMQGGVCKDIGGMAFTGRSLPAIKQRIHNYVATMRSAGKTPECIRVSVDDYGKLATNVAKQCGLKRDEICGLKHDGTPVVALHG
jgi:hypothetical protein